METEATPTAVTQEPERFQAQNVMVVSLGHTTHDIFSSFLPALLPFLIERFTLTNTIAGMLSMVYSLPSVFQPAIGYLADKRNLRLAVAFAPAIGGILMSSLGLAPNVYFLVLMLFLAGLNSSGLHAVGPSLGSKFSGGRLGRGMSFWMIGGELGFSFGPLLVVTALGFINLEQLPWLAIIGIVVSYFMWTKMRWMDTRSTLSEKPKAKNDRVRGMLKVFLPISLLVLSRSMMSTMLTTFLPTFLRSEGASIWFSGAAMTLIGSAGAVGSFISGSLSDRIGRKKVVGVSLIITPLLMLAFLHVKGLAQVPLLLLIGFFSWSIIPVMMAMVMEQFIEDRSFATGVYMALTFILNSAAMLLVGKVADMYSLRVSFMISAFLLPIGLISLFLIPKPPSRVHS